MLESKREYPRSIYRLALGIEAGEAARGSKVWEEALTWNPSLTPLNKQSHRNYCLRSYLIICYFPSKLVFKISYHWSCHVYYTLPETDNQYPNNIFSFCEKNGKLFQISARFLLCCLLHIALTYQKHFLDFNHPKETQSHTHTVCGFKLRLPINPKNSTRFALTSACLLLNETPPTPCSSRS